MQECWNRDVTMEREREEEKEICRQIDTETTRHAQINSVRIHAHARIQTRSQEPERHFLAPPLSTFIQYRGGRDMGG